MRLALILGFVVTSLLLASVALAVPDTQEPVPLCRAEACAVSGGAYQLTTLVWQVEGSVSGGGYRLDVPEAPSVRGSGCCCTYLPMILRQAP